MGGAGAEDSRHTGFLEQVYVLFRDSATHEHQHVVNVILFEQLHDAGNDGVMSAGENRETDYRHVFLQRGADDHLRRLAQAGVDDLHAGVAQSAGNHLGAAVVAVEARLGYQDADFSLSRHNQESSIYEVRSWICNAQSYFIALTS